MKSSKKVAPLAAMGNYFLLFLLFLANVCAGVSIVFSNFRPYENRWSKTMIGYGPELNHFVVELTYNYGVTSYDLGTYLLENFFS